MRRLLSLLLVACLGTLSAVALADEAPPELTPLEELLERVSQGWNAERTENAQRELTFRENRDAQQQLLEEARAAMAYQEARSDALESRFGENELTLAQLEETLRQRLGALGELFGVVRQVAGDASGNLASSLVSAQLPGRDVFLSELGQSKTLPSIEALERLWFILHQEMTELGKVVRFPATIVTVDGEEVQTEVIRVGAFNAISGGKYLRWDSETQRLTELARQPAGIYLSTLPAFEAATSGMASLAIDPSRGSILSMLILTPDARERVEQGGPVGYTIIVLGILAGLLAVSRWVAVFIAGRKVSRQKTSKEISVGNPLGRVLAVYQENESADTESLELKLDEVILRETSRLERLLWAIQVVSVVAPLMGLLGTVTGMIQTFQAITLFGTDDPKMMANGISEALVTTMLGLCVAIPLVLLHAVVSSGSRSVVEVLEEQAAGLVARRSLGRDAVV
jgi:biopolymer transport protein ExbB